jgi:CheY-like chemotaxis protein
MAAMPLNVKSLITNLSLVSATETWRAPSSQPAGADADNRYPMGAKNCRVLVIEDDPSIREVIACMLRSGGLEVIEAENGQNGFDLARTADPALILSDVRMPNMDGFEVLNCLRHEPATFNIPIIFMTGWADCLQVANQLARGVEVLQKPFNTEMLFNSVWPYFREISPISAHNCSRSESLRASNLSCFLSPTLNAIPSQAQAAAILPIRQE